LNTTLSIAVEPGKIHLVSVPMQALTDRDPGIKQTSRRCRSRPLFRTENKTLPRRTTFVEKIKLNSYG
jgi:hypothetical protein